MPVSSSTEHWIKPDALTINLNHFGDPDYLQVSVLAGAVVMAFKQDVIVYNAAHNYRTWPLDAANTYLETTSSYNVYACLTRSEVNARALVVYDPVLRDIEGREITYAEDGSEVLGDANTDYFFVFLGQISASVNSGGSSVQREWIKAFTTGNLDTNQQRNNTARLLDLMFRPHYENPLNPDEITWIEALSNLGVNGGVTMFVDGGKLHLPSIYDGLPIDGVTLYWENGVLKATGGQSGGVADSVAWPNVYGKPSWITDTKPVYDYSEIKNTPDLSLYATQSWVTSQGYASSTSLASLQSKVDNFLEGSDTDTIINKWLELEAFLSGLSESDNLATILSTKASLDYVNKTFVTIAGNEEVTGVHDFANGLKIGGISLSKTQDDVVYLDGNLVVRGGITMYGTDGVTAPYVMSFLNLDPNTLEINAKGQLTVIGGTGGGIADSVAWENITGKPTFATVATSGSYNDLLNKPTIPTSLKNPYSLTFGSKTYDGSAARTITASDLGALTTENYINYITKSYVDGLKVDADLLDGHNYSDFTLKGTYTLPAKGILRLDVRGECNYLVSIRGTNSGRDALVYVSGYGDGTSIRITARIIYSNSIFSYYFNGSSETTGAFYIVSGYSTGSDSVCITNLRDSNDIDVVEVSTLPSDATLASVDANILATLNSNVASATKLQTARTIWGQSFDGTSNISGAFSGATTGSFSDKVSMKSASIDGIGIYKSATGVLRIDGDLVVSGGVTMYGTDSVNASTIMDAIAVDGKTVSKANGYLEVIGGVGGVGSVTSVGLKAPTGFSVSGSPITSSGTLTLSFANGYSLPTTTKQTNWDTAYGWGNHASAGYLKTHQTLYTLTLQKNGTQIGTFKPTANATINITMAKGDVGLGNVENTALSTWTGSSNIKTVGTITSGTWNGTKIANGYLANSAISISGTSVSLGESITQAALRTALGLGSNAYTSTAYLPLSGGTLTGGLTISVGNLIVSGSDTVTKLLYPAADNTYNLGQASRKWANIYTTYINGYTPITSGNYADYITKSYVDGLKVDADLLDGLQLTGLMRCDYNKGSSEDVVAEANLKSGVYRWSATADNMPDGGGYGNSLVVRGHSSAADTCYILYGSYSADRLFFRRGTVYSDKAGSITTSSWKEVAFLDSNVASATKLQTARTIWGQSFDGSGNVSGAFSGATTGSFSSNVAIGGKLDVVGNILTNGGVTMYSDIRKKHKLQDVELTLKQVADAPLIEHYYLSDQNKTTHVGSIAQYWAGLNDWFCKEDNEGYYTMEIQNAALASAISVARELTRYESKTDKKIRLLKKRICELEDEIEKLKTT